MVSFPITIKQRSSAQLSWLTMTWLHPTHQHQSRSFGYKIQKNTWEIPTKGGRSNYFHNAIALGMNTRPKPLCSIRTLPGCSWEQTSSCVPEGTCPLHSVLEKSFCSRRALFSHLLQVSFQQLASSTCIISGGSGGFGLGLDFWSSWLEKWKSWGLTDWGHCTSQTTIANRASTSVGKFLEYTALFSRTFHHNHKTNMLQPSSLCLSLTLKL